MTELAVSSKIFGQFSRKNALMMAKRLGFDNNVLKLCEELDHPALYNYEIRFEKDNFTPYLIKNGKEVPRLIPGKIKK